VNLHLLARGLGFDAAGKFVAVRLADGGSDNALYDTRRDAVRHQFDEKLCAYVRVTPNGMNVCAAESFMATQRKLYDAGFRLTDPDDARGGKQVVPRLMRESQAASFAALKR
jgi:hypothetical protein